MSGRASNGQRTHRHQRNHYQAGALHCRRRRRQPTSDEASVEPAHSFKNADTVAIREEHKDHQDDTMYELRRCSFDLEAAGRDMTFDMPLTAAECVDDVPDCPNLDEYDTGESTCAMWSVVGEVVTILLLCTRTVCLSVLGQRRVLLLLIGALFIYAMATHGQWRRAMRGDSLLADSMRLAGYSVQLSLRLVERTLLGGAMAVGELDSVVGAVYCDLASALCDRFDVLCSDKCSFVQAALGMRRAR